ncbi:MAG: hypothetical protein U5O12_18530 [Rhodoferax sp.]|nr:hypothetical protein [Rhodoferax sp.]
MTAPNYPEKPQSTDSSVSDLVDALNTLRDSLLDASMALRDYQFEMDTAQRSYANEAASAVMARFTTGLR